jgi:hypothetical protein
MSDSYRDKARFVAKMETKPKYEKKEVSRTKQKQLTLSEIKALFDIEE